jgi:hypothetical protein
MIVARLAASNRLRSSSAVAPGGPIVSLTSYGNRIKKVFLTIESIAIGNVLPSRLILWLDDQSFFRNPPAALTRLVKRGVEVRFSENFGPHTKYYPYLENTDTFNSPLVTADDDILYPRDWLEKLVFAFRERPDVVNCYRARLIPFLQNGLAKYDRWQLCESTDASFQHFATGVSGVIYPPGLLAAIKKAGRAFQQCCPKADDIWLHAQALRAGYKVRQFVPKAVHFTVRPGTQQTALQYSNAVAADAGNDRQAMSTYSDSDLATIFANRRKCA